MSQRHSEQPLSDGVGTCERRVFDRYRCMANAEVIRHNDTAAGRTATYPAWVYDISPQGLGLVVPVALRTSEPLTIRLLKSDAQLTLQATVRHVAPLDGESFEIGCALDQWLSPEDVKGFHLVEQQS